MRLLLYCTGATVLMAIAFTLLMFDAALARVSGLGVAAFGMYAVASLSVSYLLSMPVVRARAQRLDLEGSGK